MITAEGPFSVSAVEANIDLVDNVQAFRSTTKRSRLKDGESRKSVLCVCYGRDMLLTKMPN